MATDHNSYSPNDLSVRIVDSDAMVILFSYFDHVFFPLSTQNGYFSPLRYTCDSEKVTMPRNERGMNMNKKWISIAAVALLLSGSLVACSSTTGTPEPATQQEEGSATTPGTSSSDSTATQDQSTDDSKANAEAPAGSSDSTGSSTDSSTEAGSTDSKSDAGSAGTSGTENSSSTDTSKQ